MNSPGLIFTNEVKTKIVACTQGEEAQRCSPIQSGRSKGQNPRGLKRSAKRLSKKLRVVPTLGGVSGRKIPNSEGPNALKGYHGSEESVVDGAITGLIELSPSEGDGEWLGWGIYFWLDILRAWQWAKDRKKFKSPAVLGAVIDLGKCLNLSLKADQELLIDAYNTLVTTYELKRKPLPVNDGRFHRLDCAVIETLQWTQTQCGQPRYDTIMGAFSRGEQLYPGATFRASDHVQICVANPKRIKSVFRAHESMPRADSKEGVLQRRASKKKNMPS